MRDALGVQGLRSRHCCGWSFAAFVATVSLGHAAIAADIPKGIDPSKVASAGEIPKPGDNFLFRQPLNIFQLYDLAKPGAKEQAGEAAKTVETFCARSNAWAKVLAVPTATDNNYYVIFPSERWYELSLAHGGLPGLSQSIQKNQEKDDPCKGNKPVTNDVTYKFDKNVLDKIDVSRFGTTYGALVVPFKFHFSDHTLDASSAVLGYFGYEGWITGASSSVYIAAGLSSVNIPSSGGTSGSASNTAKAALTAGVGVNWTFGTTSLWKGGFIVGWDWAGKSSGYQYEHRPWLAVSLGLGF
jgi:hypothetical protein